MTELEEALKAPELVAGIDAMVLNDLSISVSLGYRLISLLLYLNVDITIQETQWCRHHFWCRDRMQVFKESDVTRYLGKYIPLPHVLKRQHGCR